MNEQGENGNPVSSALSAIEEAALDSDIAEVVDAPRDICWLRWLKFVSVIVFPAIILGLGFLFEDYIEQCRADTSYTRAVADRNVEHDTIGAMKFRFWLGASVGGGLGLIYVARCVVRKVDP